MAVKDTRDSKKETWLLGRLETYILSQIALPNKRMYWRGGGGNLKIVSYNNAHWGITALRHI